MRLRFLLVFLIILGCKTERNTTSSQLNYLLPNASVYIKITNPESFTSELRNNGFIEKMGTTAIFSNIVKKLNTLDFKDNAVLGIYPVGKGNHEFILLQETDAIPFENIALDNKQISYQKESVTRYTVNGQEFFSVLLNGKRLTSSSQLLLENTIRTKGKNAVSKTLEKLYRSTKSSSSASFFFNLENPSIISSELRVNNEPSISTFSDWISADFSATPDELLLSGIAIANDSTQRFMNLFKNTSPLPNKTAFIAPKNADAVLSFTFGEYNVFQKNQDYFLDRVRTTIPKAENIEEIGVIFLNDEKAVALHAFNDEKLTASIQKIKTGAISYQSVDIWKLDNTFLLDDLCKPLIKQFTPNFYTVFENTHVFAENQSTLQTIISNKKSATTFEKSAVYQAVNSQISTESSMLFVARKKGIQYFIDKHFKMGLSKEFSKLSLQNNAMAAQFTIDGDFAHCNVYISKIKKTPRNTSVAPIYNLELDSDLVIDPQFVKNHRTGKYEIVVQDNDNKLYLISTEGKVLWKKQLEGTIRGKIHQVDLYKNGKLQLAFCTQNQFLILDRNGEEVVPFNLTYKSGNLNPLAVFDYENSKNYRFVVTQGRKVFMYNSDGKIVDGFTYKEAESPIIKAPKHFKLGKKDYLVFMLENGKLKIRHRVGKDRVKVNRTIAFSNNEVFFYKNQFSVTDKKGVLHQIDTNGKLSATNFNLDENHGMYATSKTLALINDNILSIKGKKVDLEFGVYTKPKIFYINDKIYVSVTDIQNQKIYLFDSQAKPIPNFPVYGISSIDLLDMNNDGKLEFVAKDQENSIIVYTIN